MGQLTTDLSQPDLVPWFLWNEHTTVGQLRDILRNPQDPLRSIYAARLMREAKVREVWNFLTPQEVSALWPDVERHLGRRRRFWRFLLDTWRSLGAI